MCEECKKLKKKLAKIEATLDGYVGSTQDALRSYSSRDGDVEEALACPLKELPLFINKPGEVLQDIVKRRLAGKRVKLTPSECIQVMSNIEFDYDDYRNIGWNDGTMILACDIYKVLGKDKKSVKAYGNVYTD